MIESNYNHTKYFKLVPLFAFVSLAVNAFILVFSGLTTLRTPKTSFKNRVLFLFANLSFKFGIIFSLVFLVILITILISVISGKNIINHYWLKVKFINIKYFHYILIISMIDIFLYLIIYKLITPYSTAYSITEFFTEPVYLSYLILYYKMKKNVHFNLKQIITSYSFFIVGIILMIIGLSIYYCESIVITHEFFGFNLSFNKYYCKGGTSNYFYNNHYSIIISIFIIPFLFFAKMFLAKKYMEKTEFNAFIVMFKNYFTEFIISVIILLIATKGKFGDDDFPFNKAYIGVYSLGSDFQELLFLFYLQKTNLYFIFILLVFRKLHFHLLAGFNAKANYFLFLIPPIITNILGFIAFTYQKDSESEIMIYATSLETKLINETNDYLENQEITKTDDGENLLLNKIESNNISANDIKKDDNITDDFNKEGGAPPLLVNQMENFDNREKYRDLEIERLKSENKSLNLKIKSLQIKNKTLEETNEKLTNKIAMLCEKYNINEDDEELNYMKP